MNILDECSTPLLFQKTRLTPTHNIEKAEERISKLYNTFEIIESEEQKEKQLSEKSLKDIWDTIKHTNTLWESQKR